MEMVIKFIIKILSFFFLTTLIFFLSSSNPIFLCLGLISFSFLTGSLLSLTVTKWLFMAIILIFLGGMMVVFIYVTALSQSQKFFLPSILINPYYILLVIVVSNFFVSSLTASWPGAMQELFYHSFFNLFIMIVFLLWTLFLSVKLVENFKGAFKSFF